MSKTPDAPGIAARGDRPGELESGPTGRPVTDADLHWQALRALSWSTFHFTLPLGWEVTAYLLRADHGQLRLHERDTFVGQLDWRAVPAAPDLPRTMQASAVPTGQTQTSAPRENPRELALSTYGAFLLGESADGAVHAATYQAPTKLLIHWIFPPAQRDARARALGVLDGYAENRRPLRVFELFGLGVRLPSGFGFMQARAQPADVTLHWANDEGRHLTARRIGMDAAVLAQTTLARLAEDALHRQGAGIDANEPRAWRGHPGLHTRFVQRAERGLDALISRPGAGESRWWHDAREGRIYALTQWGPSSTPPLELDEVWVRGR